MLKAVRFCFSGDDMEIPADTWETVPCFETQKHGSNPSCGSSVGGATAPQREDAVNNNFGGHRIQRSATQGEAPSLCTGMHTSVVSRGASGSMRLQAAAPAPLLAVKGGTCATGTAANKGNFIPAPASTVEASFSADDFFASVEREAAKRNI